MTARPYKGGVPAPPKEIGDEITASWDDPVRRGIAEARYFEWLEQQGYRQPTLGRSARADESAR